MAYHNYHIQQQTLDLRYYTVAKAAELQSRVSLICNQSLFREMELLLDRIIPAGASLKLDQLVLEVDPVSDDDLERDLVPAILMALEREIGYMVDQGINFYESAAPHELSGRADDVTALTYFLSYGVLPLWAKSDGQTDINLIAEDILKKNPAKLRQVLYRLGSYSYVQKRLANQFKEPVIKEMILLIEPAEAPFIFNYRDHVIQSARRKPPLADKTDSLGTALWEFIFRVLLTESTGRFNRKMFIRSTVRSVAENFNTSYEVLLKLLNNKKALQFFAQRDFEVAKLLGELWLEQPVTDEKKKLQEPETLAKDEQGQPDNNLVQLYHYLRHQSLPAFLPTTDKTSLKRVFRQLITDKPAQVLEILRSLNFIPDIGTRVVDLLDVEGTLALIPIIEPAYADEIIDYHAGLRTIHQESDLVQAPYSELEASIWSVIMNYLLTETGSSFSSRRFLEYSFRNTANHYNLDLRAFLRALKMSAGIITNTARLHIFIETIDELLVAESPASQTMSHVSADHQHDLDVLYFWLEHGTMPWWAGASVPEPRELFAELSLVAFDKVLQLLMLAGTRSAMRNRILDHIPISFLLAVFKNLNGGNNAVKALFAWQQMVRAIPGMAEQGNAYERYTLQALWETYALTGYRSFSPEHFIEVLVMETAVRKNIPVGKVMRLLKNEMMRGGRFNVLETPFANIQPASLSLQELAGLKMLLSDAGSLSLTLQESSELKIPIPDTQPSSTAEESAESKKSPVKVQPSSLSLQELAEEERQLFSTSELSKESETGAFFLRIYEALKYFLTHNKLPGGINAGGVGKDAVIIRLLTILMRGRQDLVTSLFSQPASAAAKIYIQNLFSNYSGPASLAVKNILEANLDADIARYIASISGMATESLNDIQLVWEQLIKGLATPAGKMLFYQLVQQASFTRYAAANLSDAQFTAIIRQSSSGWGGDMVDFLNYVSEIFTFGMDGQVALAFKSLLRQFNLRMLFSGNEKVSLELYLRRFMVFSQDHFKQTDPVLRQKLLEKIKSKSGFYGTIVSILPQLELFIDATASGPEANRVINDQLLLEPYPNVLLTNLQPTEGPEENPAAVLLAPEIVSGDTFFVNNAGLVILHPFLTTYFSRLEMLEDGRFKTEELMLRAVHLLQYLVDGSVNQPEQELLLNKILAGVPPEMPVPTEIILSDKEIEISAQLLTAVTQQWEKMKTGTVPGFQHSFLQRQGLLALNEENWELRVEFRAYDLLLQTLPWGIGYIKLNWMETPLSVEWAFQ